MPLSRSIHYDVGGVKIMTETDRGLIAIAIVTMIGVIWTYLELKCSEDDRDDD